MPKIICPLRPGTKIQTLETILESTVRINGNTAVEKILWITTSRVKVRSVVKNHRKIGKKNLEDGATVVGIGPSHVRKRLPTPRVT